MFEHIAAAIAIGSLVAIWWLAEREMREGHRARIARMEEERGDYPTTLPPGQDFGAVSLPPAQLNIVAAQLRVRTDLFDRREA